MLRRRGAYTGTSILISDDGYLQIRLALVNASVGSNGFGGFFPCYARIRGRVVGWIAQL